jgi:predicted aldo/keto reductase-like oxidoreductase
MEASNEGLKMEKRKMEKLGVEASLLGFGCMRFPVKADGKIDREKSQEMLDKAYAAGVNYYDTAYPYHDGESELFVGEAMKKYDRHSFYLATKLPSWLVAATDDVDRLLQEQLDKLQTEYIDFYLMHALDKERWAKLKELGVYERLQQFKAQGKIKYIGFSFHDDYPAFEEILNAYPWDFCQIQFNYVDANEQAGLKGVQLANEKNIPLVIMEPVKGGSLAYFSGEITDKIKKACGNEQASAASFALRWVGSQPGVKVILSGMSSMEQVEDNLQTFSPFKPFTQEEFQAAEEIVKLINSRVQNGCTGCRYCMPCPAGVNIPGCFSAWNTYHMFQNYNVVKWKWEQEIGPKGQASNCIGCGACETKCPQKLSIREDLKRVQADMDKREMIF